MKIRSKILLYPVILIFLIVVLISSLVYSRSLFLIIAQYKNEMLQQANTYSDALSEKLQEQLLNIQLFSKDTAITAALKSSDYSVFSISLTNRINEFTGNTDGTDYTFVIKPDLTIIGDTNFGKVGSRIPENEFIKSALSGKESISNLQSSENSNQGVIIFYYPVKDEDSNVIGVIGNAIRADYLFKNISHIKIGTTKKTFAYVVSSNGNVIFSGNKSNPGKVTSDPWIKPILKRVILNLKVPSDIVQSTTNNSNYLNAYSALRNTNWVFVINSDYSEIKQPATSLIQYIILIGFLTILISSISSTIISSKITSPILKATELIKATGDLNLCDDNSYKNLLSNKDETSIMANAIFHTRSTLKEIAQSLFDTSKEIKNTVSVTETLTSKANQALQNNSYTMSELSSGFQQTAASIEQIMSSSEKIKASVDLINNVTSETKAFTNQIKGKADLTKEDILKSRNETISTYANVKERLENAINQSDKISQVNELLSLIQDITEKTKLLSFNAAIEAAHAGENGKGFSIVAEEIRKLSESSSSTANHIKEIMDIIRLSVIDLSENSVDILNFVDKKVLEDYNKIILVSAQYSEDADNFDTIMTDINSKVSKVDSTLQNIVQSINQVSNILNISVDEITNISSNTDEIVDDMEVIKNNINHNLEYVHKLKAIIEKFDLEEE